jgi:hypothetical protein
MSQAQQLKDRTEAFAVAISGDHSRARRGGKPTNRHIYGFAPNCPLQSQRPQQAPAKQLDILRFRNHSSIFNHQSDNNLSMLQGSHLPI